MDRQLFRTDRTACRPGVPGSRRALALRLGVILVLAALAAFLFTAPGAATQKTVVIDPGHGGNDPGAVDKANGILEKNINLQVARRTQAALTGQGARVIMTREDDELLCQTDGRFTRRHVSLTERTMVANRNAAGVFLSIHSNMFYDPDCSGIEIYHFHLSEEGRILALEVQKALEGLPNPLECKVRPANYYVLRNTTMPALLIEIGYISHLREGRMLLEPTYQQMLADAFARAVNSYLEWSRLRRAGSAWQAGE